MRQVRDILFCILLISLTIFVICCAKSTKTDNLHQQLIKAIQSKPDTITQIEKAAFLASLYQEAGEHQKAKELLDAILRGEEKIYLEAESATTLTPFFEILDDPGTLGGKFIVVPDTPDESHTSGEPLGPNGEGDMGTAKYSFVVTQEGEYQILGRIFAGDVGANSFWVSVDEDVEYLWTMYPKAKWAWEPVTWGDTFGLDANRQVIPFPLTKGTHTLTIRIREDGTMLDAIVICPVPADLTNITDEEAPDEIREDVNATPTQQKSEPSKVAESDAKEVGYVLSLDGGGDYVEIKESQTLNSLDSQVTLEVWIKPIVVTYQWMPIIYKGDEFAPGYANRSYSLFWEQNGSLHLCSAPNGREQISLQTPVKLIALGEWYHVAGVIDGKNGFARILINGVEVASRDFNGDLHVSMLPLRIGWTHEERVVPDYSAFSGLIDEVRIWNIARTQRQIQATMNTTLAGQEEGLVGYWNFDDGTAKDLSPNGNDGTLFGDAQIVEASLPDEFIPAGTSVVILDDKIANSGEQFTTSISVRLAEELHSFSFDLAFDPTVLQAVSAKEGAFLSRNGVDTTSWQTPTIDNENGIIRNIHCSKTQKEGVGEKGMLATVTFEAVEIGCTDLTLQNLRLLSPTDEEIKVSARKGQIKVYPHGSISGVVLDLASNQPIKGAKVEISKDNFAFGVWTYSADDGTYTINGVPVGDFDVTASKNDYLFEVVPNAHVEVGRNTKDININLEYLPMAPAITVKTPPVVGEIAPDFSAKSLDGKTIKLSSFKEKVVILNFWATWAPKCIIEMIALEELYKAHKDELLDSLSIPMVPTQGRTIGKA